MSVPEPSTSDEWVIMDVEELSRANPRSFFIGPRAERESLRPGDLAYLVFRLRDPTESGGGGGGGGERLWVQVIEKNPHHYRGAVDNEPVLLRAISYREEVVFGPEHIAGVARFDAEPENPFVRLKVGVRDKAIDDDIRPRQIFRETPTNEKDSGWRVLIGDETPEIWDDEHAIRWPSLGWLSDLWPEVVAVFRQDPRFEQPPRELGEDERLDFSWDVSAGAYVRD